MRRLFILLLLLLLPHSGLCHESTATRADIGIDEKLGQLIPTDTVFIDENNDSVNLRNMIDKPTIIAPVYFGCMHECPLLLNGVAAVLSKIDNMKPGKDFHVIALSFDDKDTPAIARDKKRNYIKAIGHPFPENAWTFLTGTEPNIKKFTDSVGFKYQRDGAHDFSHPVVLIIVGPGGKIIRYLEGVNFLPFEVTMALTEAAAGHVGSPARKVLMYCFSYDPLKKTYVFNILKVTGTVMALSLGSFFIYLVTSTRKKRKYL